MIYKKYLDFITEAHNFENGTIYWNFQVDGITDKEWYDISISKSLPRYFINFRVKEKDEKYNYHSVIIEKKGNDDFYYMEDPTLFIKKFKEEFWKNASEYIKNFKYEPKCLGNLEHVKSTNKYNL